MSSATKDFHHYKGDDLTRFEKVERKVIELIYTHSLSEKREDSQVFEFMHAAGCMQIGRILAQKRHLNIDVASTACILHDISTITSGVYKDHAKRGAELAKKILTEIGGFSNEEIYTITQAVLHHSEKDIRSDNLYVELVKDADVFECSLYKNAEGFYKLHKSPAVFEAYVARIKNVRKELGLKPEEVFR